MSARTASVGPWIALGDLDLFSSFCVSSGYTVRVPVSLNSDLDVYFEGHWMSVRWNKNNRRYTADRRLSSIVQKFVSERKKNVPK